MHAEARLPLDPGDPAGTPLRGIELRSLLVLLLSDSAWPLTVPELGRRLRERGFTTPGRPGKAISDALRWEVRRGRVQRLARGTYGPGRVSRQTRWRMRQRLRNARGGAGARP